MTVDFDSPQYYLTCFWKRTIQETLQHHHTSISIGGRPLSIFQFAHDIDLMGGSSNELHDLTSRVVARASADGMEVSTEKSKVMVNSTNGISVNITMNGQPLEEVTSFKYLGATLSKDDTCRAEIRILVATATAVNKLVFYAQSPVRLYQGDTATAAMARLNRMWKSNISFQTKFQLFKSLVVSNLLYGCETWLSPSCSTDVRHGCLHPALQV